MGIPCATLSAFEVEALKTLSRVLINIRLIASRDKENLEMKLIYDLTDSIHNLPKLIADNNMIKMADLANIEVLSAKELLKTEGLI